VSLVVDEEVGDTSVRRRLQRLPALLQALAVGYLAQARSDDDSFATKDVSQLFLNLRLPPIPNYSATFDRLRKQGLLMNPQKGRWALTPKGEERLEAEATTVDLVQTNAVLSTARGADLGDIRHTTIPPFLGPDGMAAGIESILSKSPFENNVMLITRFPKSDEDHFGGLISAIRDEVARHGLVLHVASDGNARDTLWENVVTYMWSCKYAIVLVDAADGNVNSNVMIEVGGMLMTGRRCAIIRDASVPAMPSDLVGHIYKAADLSNHAETVQLIASWIQNDLGLGKP